MKDRNNRNDGSSQPLSELHAQLLNALPQIVLLVGNDNQLIYANARAELFFNTSHTILERLRLEDLFHFDCPLLSLVQQVRRNSGSITEYNVEIGSIRHRSNELMDLRVSTMALNARQQALIVVLQPRSIAQKIERQLAHRGAARSVSGLAAMLAHEIRNPLSGIRGAAQLLEGSIDPEDRTLTTLICDETDRVSRLVDRMEVFSASHVQNRENINIHAVLIHVVQVAKTGFAANIDLEEIYDPSLPDLSGSKDLLIQLMLNLVKNAAEAIEHMGKKGKIWLTTSYRPGVSFKVPGAIAKTHLPLQITVEDNGPGISEDIAQYLFDPFVTTKASGTGLGLALVAKIIKDHGGVIEHERLYDRTIFKLLLPHAGTSRSPTKEDKRSS